MENTFQVKYAWIIKSAWTKSLILLPSAESISDVWNKKEEQAA